MLRGRFSLCLYAFKVDFVLCLFERSLVKAFFFHLVMLQQQNLRKADKESLGEL